MIKHHSPNPSLPRRHPEPIPGPIFNPQTPTTQPVKENPKATLQMSLRIGGSIICITIVFYLLYLALHRRQLPAGP